MNRYNKNVPFRGSQRGSTIRGRVSKFSSSSQVPKTVNNGRYQQSSATSSYCTQNKVSTLGKGKSITKQTTMQSGFRPPQLIQSNRNSTVIGRSTYNDNSDEMLWEEQNFDVDDPMITTQNQQQGFYENNKRYNQFVTSHPYQRINPKMSAENFASYPINQSKRRPLMEVQSRQNRQNQTCYGHNPSATWANHHNLYSVASTSHDTTYIYDGNDDNWLSEMVPIQNITKAPTKKMAEINNEDISTPLQSNSHETKIGESNFPRIFTVSISKLLSWNKHNIPGEIIFEVFGILDVVKINKCAGIQTFTLKGQQKGRIECTFRSIDRKLAIGHTGQWHRCIGLLKKNGEFQCLSLRSATQGELASVDCILLSNSKALAHLFRQYSK